MAARALPSRDTVLQLLRYDPGTGEFVWLPRPREMFPSLRSFAVFNGSFAGRRAGCTNGIGYIVIRFGGHLWLAHRLAWFYVHGDPMPPVIDHIDCDPRNNQLNNLRAATQRQNLANTKRHKNNRTGFKGVYRQNETSTRFFAQIMSGGKLHYLGTFATAELAAEARSDAAARLHGVFARS